VPGLLTTVKPGPAAGIHPRAGPAGVLHPQVETGPAPRPFLAGLVNPDISL